MPTKGTSNVDAWLKRETPRVRRALESASRHFDAADNLTVNTLEAVYGQENSFGTQMGTRGSSGPAGHFQFEPPTARRYGLNVSKENDQRFDIDRASSAASRYLKDLHKMFRQKTGLPGGRVTTAVTNVSERKKFVKVLRYEVEFAIKSPADKTQKQKEPRDKHAWCTEGRWRTIDDRPVFICA